MLIRWTCSKANRALVFHLAMRHLYEVAARVPLAELPARLKRPYEKEIQNTDDKRPSTTAESAVPISSSEGLVGADGS